MTRPVKILIGLAAAMLMGWLWHGPGGQGAALVTALEREANANAANAELAGIRVRLPRKPLGRSAVISGQANDLQREGLGSQMGVIDYVRNTPGIAGARWDDQPAPFALPLLAELLILIGAAFFVGLGIGVLFFGRRKRESFLD